MNHIVALPIVIDRAVHVGFLQVFEMSLISLLIGYHQKAILTHSLSMDLRTHVTMVTQTRHSRDTSERPYSGSDTTKWSPELWTSSTCKWTVCLFWSFPNTSWRFDCFHPFQWNRFQQSLASILFIRCWSQWLDCQTTSNSESLWHFFQLKEHMPVNKTNRSLKKWRNFAKRMPNSKHQTSRELSLWDLRVPLQTREPQVLDSLNIFQEQRLQVLYLKIQNQNYLMKPAFFGTHPPERYGRAKVDQWIKKNVPKAKQSEVKTTFSALKTECDALVVVGKPNLGAILTDWRLTIVRFLTKQVWTLRSDCWRLSGT